MPTDAAKADDLSTRRGDHFAVLRQQALEHVREHGCPADVAQPWQARRLAVMARAVRATYVLHVGAGTGYTSLHIASAFGHTGRLDAVESDATHAQMLEAAAGRYAFGDRIRAIHGRAQDAVPPMNGPYDLVAVERQHDALDVIYEDLLRLTRIGGALIALPRYGDAMLDMWADRLAADERIEYSHPADNDVLIAVRVR